MNSRMWFLLSLTVVSLLPALGSRFLPFHDYPNGVFQGYLLRLARLEPGLVFQHYELVRSPVPYSAWALVSWAFGYIVSSPDMMGKLFFALSTISFVGGTAYLIRSVQGRPTALELLPLVGVYDRYVWDGILNYHMALGLLFLSVGYLHRATEAGHHWPRSRATLVLSLLGMATYLSHALGWAPLCLVALVYSYSIFRRHGVLGALRTLAFLLPSAGLLLWYASSRTGHISAVLYPSLLIKLYSWFSVFLLFFRIEPFGIQPPIPFVLNLLALLAVLVLMLSQADRGDSRGRPRFDHVAAASALACLACAAMIPFILFANMGPPDARFLQPALWLGVAAIRYRRRSTGRDAAVVVLIGLVLAVNATQFVRIAPLLEGIFQTTDRVVPAGASVYSISLRSAPTSVADAVGSGSLARYTVGMPILDYFDLYRFMSREQIHAGLGMFGVGLLREKAPLARPQLMLDVLPPLDTQPMRDMAARRVEGYDFIQVLGIPKDVQLVASWFAPAYVQIVEEPNLIVLSRWTAAP